MKCEKCPRPAKFKVEEIGTPENKKYILCHVHYVDLCVYIATNAAEFLLKG